MARAFTTKTDKIDCGTSATLTPAAVTLSCWTYIPTLTFIGNNPAFTWICGRNGASSAYGFYVSSAGKVRYLLTAATGVFYDGTTTLSINTWYNLIITYNSVAGNQGYVNGSADGAGHAANGTIPSATDHFQMGDDPVNSQTFNSTSRIADVGLWNTVLTTGEISALANGALPYTIRQTALLGYWPVDGLQSPEPDLSGNKNNGTLTGTALAAGPPTMMFTPRWPQWWFISQGGLFLPTEPLTGMRVGGPFFGNPIG